MKKVLVTGAGGFIGRHCLPLLRDVGFDVHALSRGWHDTDDGVTWHDANLREDGAAARIVQHIEPTHLLHLAWNAEPGRYWTAEDNCLWVRASLALLQAFARLGGQRVVMAGTCAEYDWRYGWCSEDVTPLAPTTVYGTCKNSLQAMLSAYSRKYGLSSAWGRIFFLYGPYEHPSRLVSSVINSLLKGESALCSTGEQMRDFMHVVDVASAFVALLDSSPQGSLNIASGKGIAVKEVIQQIALKLDRQEFIVLGARPTSPWEPPLLLADVRRLKNELGWTPAMRIEQGLDDTIYWWRTRLTGVGSPI